MLLDGEGVPRVATTFDGKQVLVVSRAYDYKNDLASLKTYIRENSPVLIGVDAGADALLEAGYRPTLIVTDLDDISDAALRSGAEIVTHASSDGRVRGIDRVERLGSDARHLRDRRNCRGRRDPARARASGRAGRDGRLAHLPRGVPRPGSVWDGELVSYPGRRRRDCRRC